MGAGGAVRGRARVLVHGSWYGPLCVVCCLIRASAAVEGWSRRAPCPCRLVRGVIELPPAAESRGRNEQNPLDDRPWFATLRILFVCRQGWWEGKPGVGGRTVALFRGGTCIG